MNDFIEGLVEGFTGGIVMLGVLITISCIVGSFISPLILALALGSPWYLLLFFVTMPLSFGILNVLDI